MIALNTGPNSWINFTACLVSISVIISSLEFLSIRTEFVNGVFSERIVSSRPVSLFFFKLGFAKAILFNRKIAILATTLRLIGGLWLMASSFTYGSSATSIGVIAVCSVFLNYRNLIGGDGSDQMSLIVILSLLPAIIYPNIPEIGILSALFIAYQSTLSYFVAGVAKVISKEWRSGEAVVQILNTTSYGNSNINSHFIKFKHFGLTLSWLAIIFEITFPLSLLGNNYLMYSLLVAGILFHFSNAVNMGLNCFFWSFIATYPSVIFTSGKLEIIACKIIDRL